MKDTIKMIMEGVTGIKDLLLHIVGLGVLVQLIFVGGFLGIDIVSNLIKVYICSRFDLLASTGSDWNRFISLIVSTIALSVTAFRTAAPAENLDIYLSVPTDERAP